MAESELTEDQKLVKLGLRSPNQTISVGGELLEKLKDKIAEEFDTFQENFEDANLSSFDDFETWLTNNGFDAETAANIRNNFEQKYSSFSEFSDTVINDLESWEDFENEFSSGSGLRSDRTTDDGTSAAGIKMYEEAGIGRSGQSIPAGGVEVYGAEVHFSQTANVQDTKDESAGTEDPIVWSNLVVDPNTAELGSSVDAAADVTNNSAFTGSVTADLIVDGSVEESKTVEIPDNTTKTVLFTWSAGSSGGSFETGTYDVGVSKAGTEEVTVFHPNLV